MILCNLMVRGIIIVIVVYCDVLITIIMPLIIILQRIIFRYSSDVLSKWLK